MAHVHYLVTNNLSWFPKFARNKNEAFYAPKIAKWRGKYKSAVGNNARRQVANNFKLNYNAWLTSVKRANTQRRENARQIIHQLREAKKRARYPSPARSGKPRNNSSLLKYMHQRRLSTTKTNLRSQIANLENKRNTLQRQINALYQQMRELP